MATLCVRVAEDSSAAITRCSAPDDSTMWATLSATLGVRTDTHLAAVVPDVPELPEAREPDGCTVVLAEYDDPVGVAQAQRILGQFQSDCQLKVYAKGTGGCASYVNGSSPLDCEVLSNRGREFHTYLTHVVREYHHLPEQLIFIPLPLNKHPMRAEELSREASPHMELLHSTVKARARLLELRRLERARFRTSETHASLNEAMAGSGIWRMSSFSCLAHRRTGGSNSTWHPCDAPGYDAAEVRTVGDNSTCWGAGAPDDNCIDFTITEWNGTALLPAEPSPLHAWVHAHLGDSHSTLCSALLCLYGAFTTSADNVRARAKPMCMLPGLEPWLLDSHPLNPTAGVRIPVRQMRACSASSSGLTR
eukprot:1598329-Prymnesium_polylepis.1